jgi:hypothetical protein
MSPTFKYLWLTIKHKYFVFLAGLKTGAPLWLLIIHDWVKFLPCEAPHYGRQFFGAGDDPLGFSRAWLHHQRQPHHYEAYIMVSGHSRGGYPDGCALPMPEKYVREMVADWMGASRAYEGAWPKDLKSWKWWQDNFEKLRLHGHTRNLCRKIVEDAGIK